jgi:hypothetical protein
MLIQYYYSQADLIWPDGPFKVDVVKIFIYRRPTLYPLEIAVDFLKSL